ncbi:MAG: PadR family transcriptional regulator [Acetivibrionales bacterium]|jgi:PadR family transcriptional regulator AphA
MSLPYGILGLLTYRESTGYDLTKIFEDSLNNFWHAQSSQIYRELGRLESDGLVASRSVIQDNRPNKRVYTITEAGRKAFSDWLGKAEPVLENPHNSLLMHVFFGADDTKATLAILRKFMEQCLSEHEDACSDIRRNIEEYARFMPDGEEKSKYWLMTLDFGITIARAMAEWAERCIKQIEKER